MVIRVTHVLRKEPRAGASCTATPTSRPPTPEPPDRLPAVDTRLAASPFDPFAAASLADPYPQFAHLVEHQPVSWSADLGYWVVSRHADARRVLRDHGRSRRPTRWRRSTPLPGGRAGARRRRLPVDPDADERRSAGPHPHPAHRPDRLQPAPGRGDGAVRAGSRPSLHRRAVARGARRDRVGSRPGSCRRSSCSRSSAYRPRTSPP